MRCQRGDGDSKPLFQIFNIDSTNIKRLIANEFTWHKFIDFIKKFSQTVYFGQTILSGRHIYNRNSKQIIHRNNAHQIIVLGFVQRFQITVSSRCNDPHNFSFHKSLCQFRVFHLFAYCHFISFGNQAGNISFCRMKGDTTHGCPFF